MQINCLHFNSDTRPIFYEDSIYYYYAIIDNSENFRLESGEEIQFVSDSMSYFGRFCFPYFYWVTVELEPYGSEGNKGNNIITKIFFVRRNIFEIKRID